MPDERDRRQRDGPDSRSLTTKAGVCPKERQRRGKAIRQGNLPLLPGLFGNAGPPQPFHVSDQVFLPG